MISIKKYLVGVFFNLFLKKQSKSIECLCIAGFTGKFCEYSENAQSMFLMKNNQTLLFTDEGAFIGYADAILDDNIDLQDSCATMLNGQTIIFGGSKYEKQVY